jgi:hypothetical protein
MIRTATFSLVLLACLSSSAWAQYAGDVFFRDPSVAARQGEQATLEIQTFTGAQVLGGAHFILRFDPGQLSVEEVRPGASPQFQDALVSRPVAGGVGVVTLNGTSLSQPFGTVGLVDVVVRPLAPPGTEVEVSIEVVSLVDGESGSFPQQAGLSATILVTPPAMLQAAALLAAPDAPVTAEAVVVDSPMRRPGYSVRVVRGLWRGGAYFVDLVRVAVIDPMAPSD